MRITSLDEKRRHYTSQKCQEGYFYSHYGFKSVLLDLLFSVLSNSVVASNGLINFKLRSSDTQIFSC